SLGSIRDPLAKDVSHVRAGYARHFSTCRAGLVSADLRETGEKRTGCSDRWRVRSVVQRGDYVGLCRLANVTMVQAADFRKLYHRARRGQLNRPEVRSVLVQREMGARPVVVRE